MKYLFIYYFLLTAILASGQNLLELPPSSRYEKFIKDKELVPVTLRNFELISEVKSVEIISRYTGTKHSFEQSGELMKKELLSFNLSGNLTEQIKDYAGNINDEKTIYQYNAHEQISEMQHYQPLDTLVERTLFLYNNQFQITKTIEYDRMHPYGAEVVYVLNAKGKITQTIDTAFGDDFFQYDSTGNLAEIKRYNNLNQLTNTWIFEYDTIGNISSEISGVSNDTICYRKSYKYDKQGQLTEVSYSAIQEGNNKSLYSYNSEGSKLSVEMFSNNKLISKQVYTYDEKGNLSQKSKTNNQGNSIETAKYVYDEKGNWVKCTTHFSDFTSETKERNISYY